MDCSSPLELCFRGQSNRNAACFRHIELVATLPGEPLYAACGYSVLERYAVPLPGGLTLPVVRMWKQL